MFETFYSLSPKSFPFEGLITRIAMAAHVPISPMENCQDPMFPVDSNTIHKSTPHVAQWRQRNALPAVDIQGAGAWAQPGDHEVVSSSQPTFFALEVMAQISRLIQNVDQLQLEVGSRFNQLDNSINHMVAALVVEHIVTIWFNAFFFHRTDTITCTHPSSSHAWTHYSRD